MGERLIERSLTIREWGRISGALWSFSLRCESLGYYAKALQLRQLAQKLDDSFKATEQLEGESGT